MKILFQGDSITDCNRKYDDFYDLGDGYVKYVTDELRNRYPKVDFEFINKGISGNRTKDLVARLESDFVEIQPDIVTILIGVNDSWRRYDMNDPTSAEEFRNNYETVLKALKERTTAKIIMLESFLIYNKDHEHFREDLNPKLDETRLLAMKYADAFIPLDGLFAAACVGRDESDFSIDGFHPVEDGKKLIASHLLDVLDGFIK